jgi:peptidoglycan/LPS O-acetylase OafA/YrhL
VILVQTAILVAEVGTRRDGLGAEELRYLGANLVFANFLQPTIGDTLAGLRLNAINGSAWTLKVEIACYIALPFVLAAQRRLGVAVTVGLALLLAAYPVLLGAARGAHGATYSGLASFFLVGSLLYGWGHYLDRYKAWFLPIALAGAPLVVLGASWVMRVPIGAQVVVGLWVYCVAFASRTVTLKDDVSYGAYLLHFPLIQLGLIHGLLADDVLVTAMLVVLVTTALAWLSFRHLEGPMIRVGHRLSRDRP